MGLRPNKRDYLDPKLISMCQSNSNRLAVDFLSQFKAR